MVLSFFFDKKTPTFPNVPQNHKVILCLCTPSCQNKSDKKKSKSKSNEDIKTEDIVMCKMGFNDNVSSLYSDVQNSTILIPLLFYTHSHQINSNRDKRTQIKYLK